MRAWLGCDGWPWVEVCSPSPSSTRGDGRRGAAHVEEGSPVATLLRTYIRHLDHPHLETRLPFAQTCSAQVHRSFLTPCCFFPLSTTAMTQSDHFPRAPSPYPPAFPAPSLASSKRSSSTRSQLSVDAVTPADGQSIQDFARSSQKPKDTMVGRPPALDRRNSLASLSVAHDPNDAYDDDPTWPSGWRPYTCLLGGFFLMFNSWGLVCDAVV